MLAGTSSCTFHILVKSPAAEVGLINSHCSRYYPSGSHQASGVLWVIGDKHGKKKIGGGVDEDGGVSMLQPVHRRGYSLLYFYSLRAPKIYGACSRIAILVFVSTFNLFSYLFPNMHKMSFSDKERRVWSLGRFRKNNCNLIGCRRFLLVCWV